MKKIERFAAFILVLVLLLGVAVSCAQNISENEDVGLLSWFEGVLPGLSEADDASGDEPSGGGSSGSSGGTAPASTTEATSGSETPPTPLILWNPSSKYYTISGYTSYPLSDVGSSWFSECVGPYGVHRPELCYRSGNSLWYDGCQGLVGNVHFGSEALNWDFGNGDVTGVGISFTLNPSDCADLYASLTICEARYDLISCIPLFKIEDKRFYFVDEEYSFYFDYLEGDLSSSDFSSVSFESEEESSSGVQKILLIVSNSGICIYRNDSFYRLLTPELCGGSLELFSILNITIDGAVGDDVDIDNVCFYIK